MTALHHAGLRTAARRPGLLAALHRVREPVPMRPLTVFQAVAALAVGVRLARGRDRLPPLAPVGATAARISVVIPARDEEGRIGPCLSAVLADPAVMEVLVVDDESGDGTARLAAELGAKVVVGAPLPEGWVGKQWALLQGVEAAGGDIVVTLDADARPAPGLFGALAAALDGYDLVSAGPRFVCGGIAEQALHASFLATLVYRSGPIGPSSAPAPHRVMANGQCMAFRRTAMLSAGGFRRVRGHMTDDVALARTLAADGWAVGFLDAGGLLEVDMHESAAEVWREWGRSLPLRDVTGPGRQAADLAAIWLTAALPVLRLAAGRPTRLDLGLLAVRLLLTGALRGSYTRPGPGVLLSPLLDPLTAVRLTQATLRPVRNWRGRTYPRDAHRGAAPREAVPKDAVPRDAVPEGTAPEGTAAGVTTGARPDRPGRAGRPAPPARSAAR
ncbi:glycosyl transferase group 2 family protein [Streptosporangium minutum]|uniref:4,4'-diaponeurosporenoate glycosyltransferase n=2 Tax=Streptosporangium minutum TaxID=569862 RepID=A0A243RWZ8_9ACTN|nr:glycosyl transferase group 2 family protein [Streptosporangium minutum]